MNDPKYRTVDASSLKVEDGVKELLSSPDMQPYSRYIEAAVTGADIGPSVQEIAALPLERRYVWRVASALKWGFADLEEWNVAVDRQTLAPEDAKKLMDLLRFRPIQFCLFLKALVGGEEMERLMNYGIAVARQDA
ncbi:MAG TPA: hypothetical protein VN519_01285 [Bryobacteraceae bacterium]|nr:hypothetical protein [Bryobacteraceae bacterium]